MIPPSPAVQIPLWLRFLRTVLQEAKPSIREVVAALVGGAAALWLKISKGHLSWVVSFENALELAFPIAVIVGVFVGWDVIKASRSLIKEVENAPLETPFNPYPSLLSPSAGTFTETLRVAIPYYRFKTRGYAAVMIIVLVSMCVGAWYASRISASAIPQNNSAPLQSGAISSSPFPESSPTAYTPAIYEPFHTAYEVHKGKLGNPSMKEEALKNAYVGQHELEKAIWIQPLAKLVFLDFQSRWSSYEDPYPPDDTFSNDDCNRKRFGAPIGLSPPTGGVAKLWATDVNKWRKRMGWREWHCYFGNAYLQRFDGGFIIGPFSRSPTDKLGAQMFVLTNDGEWSAEVKPNDKAPTCNIVVAPEKAAPCKSNIVPLSRQ